MTTSLHRMPIELLEAVCEHDPNITPALRSTCRDMQSKSMRPFLKHFFEEVPVSACPVSLSILLQISLSPIFASSIKTLQFSTNDLWSATPEHWRSSHFQGNFFDPGAFQTLLGLILSRLPNCKFIGIEWNKKTLGQLRHTDHAEFELELMEDEQCQADVTKLLFGIMCAIGSSRCQVEAIYTDDGNWPWVSLVELAGLCASASSASLQMPSVLYLESYIFMETGYTSERSGLSAHPSLAGCTTGMAFDKLQVYLPNLRGLCLHLSHNVIQWIPNSFGTQLKWLWLFFDGTVYNIVQDGGAELVAALKNTPRLKHFSLRNMALRDLSGAKDLVRNLSTVETLKEVELSDLWASGKSICVREGCSKEALAVTKTCDPENDLVVWSQHLHLH